MNALNYRKNFVRNHSHAHTKSKFWAIYFLYCFIIDKSEIKIRSSFDTPNIFQQTQPKMPTIAPNKSNYINYSKFKKNDNSVFLTKNGWETYSNDQFLMNSSKQSNAKINIQSMLKSELPSRHQQFEASKMVMNRYRLNNRQKIHPRSHQENRKHRSHPKPDADNGKIWKKIANWQHKIPFWGDPKVNEMANDSQILSRQHVNLHNKTNSTAKGLSLKMKNNMSKLTL